MPTQCSVLLRKQGNQDYSYSSKNTLVEIWTFRQSVQPKLLRLAVSLGSFAAKPQTAGGWA